MDDVELIDLVPFKEYGRPAAMMVHSRTMPNRRARAAMAIMERWALVAAIPDGEDGAGRQKFRLPSAEELSSRACDIAASAFGEFAKRGWMTTIPSWDEVDKAARAKAKNND